MIRDRSRPSRPTQRAWGGLSLCVSALCVVLAGVIGGCKGKAAPRARVPKNIVSPAEKRQEPLVQRGNPSGQDKHEAEQPADKAPEAPVYGPRSKRDPFHSFVTARSPITGTKGQPPEIRTPLQRYSLDQLKVVGILVGPHMRKALLEDDAGKGYTVQVGDRVGSEGGRIFAIKKDRVIIERAYCNLLGEKKVKRVVKKLYTSEEGENP